jgi:hypothetical protein
MCMYVSVVKGRVNFVVAPLRPRTITLQCHERERVVLLLSTRFPPNPFFGLYICGILA